MRKTATNKIRLLSVVLSLLMVLSVISFPTLKPKAAAGTIDDFVERCYTVTLGRGSDPDGFADWKGQLTNGQAVGVHVAYGFLFSPEYTKKNKSPEDYVTDLYMLFMGREPDEAGFADWVGQLKDGKSRVEVFAGFANSQEFYNICESYGITAGRFVVGYDRFQVNDVNLFVERLYKVCFNRIGDRGGQRDWVEKLIKKQITGSECARNFIQSKEYENLGLSDSDYVENLYIALMGRASDAPGKTDWLTKLANGMTRDEVFAGFVNSVEFDGICKKYNIERGTYTATKKGTYDPNNPNNVPVNPSEDNPSGDNPDTPQTHTHKYNKKNTDSKYLKSAATCTKAAVYYYSCECGEKGTSTFTSGNPKGHTYNKKNTDSKYLKSAATCTEAAVYYYSCECGEKGTSKTFKSGNALGHEYGTTPCYHEEPTATEDGVEWYECTHGCGNIKKITVPCILSTANVGDTIIFGKYEQDGVFTNGNEDIEWQILSKEDGRALVISKYALDSIPFNEGGGDVKWEDSTLRAYLNTLFMDDAFSEYEQSKIPSVYLENKKNPYYGSEGGNDTVDQVFCLSLDEVENYFGDYNYSDLTHGFGYNQNLICQPTKYASMMADLSCIINSGDYERELKNYGYSEEVIGKESCYWWLRTRGPCCVTQFGKAGGKATLTSNNSVGAIRPAIYIEYVTHTHKYDVKNTSISKYLKSEATCTEPAVYYYSCSCGEYDENYTFTYGDPLGHTFDQKNTDSRYLRSAATHDEPAWYYYSCKCGEINTNNVFSYGDPRGHEFSIMDTSDQYLKSAATHSSPAVYYYSCECGEYDPDNTFTYGSTIPHDFSIKNTDDQYLKSAANCTEPAVYYYSCECGEYDPNRTFTYGEPLGHTFDQQNTDSRYLRSAATHTDPATYYYSCECGEMDITRAFVYGSPVPHEFTIENTEPTYLKTAATHSDPAVYYYSCECGAYDPDHTFTYGSTIPHVFDVKSTDSKYLKSAATCTENAVYYYSCECGEYDPTQTFTKARSALGHRFATQDTSDIYLKSAATCTEPAVYYYKCSREGCEEHGTATFTYGDPLGHDCDDWTIIENPTLTECGEKTGYCNRCSAMVTEKIPCLLSQANVGDTFMYGKYEQDGVDTNGAEDIEWRILSKEDGRVLVISEYILDNKKYNESSGGSTWDNSSLRIWLNGDFLNAFSVSERSHIPLVTLENKNNSVYNTSGGSETDDYVFCLSVEEAEKYFGDYYWQHSDYSFGTNEKLIAYPTQKIVKDNQFLFDAANLLITSDAYDAMLGQDCYSGYSSDIIGHYVYSWWLRTPGKDADYTCTVGPLGHIGEYYYSMTQYLTNNDLGVRPAMYIEYETE